MNACLNRQLLPKIEIFCRPEWTKWKMDFEYFQIQKRMLQTVILEKVDEENAVICLVSVFLS